MVAFVLVVAVAMASAQANPALGTWKLNVAKSKGAADMPLPKSLTRTSEAMADGVKLTYKGVAADGSEIAFTFNVAYDGKDVPVTGKGQPFGADMIAVKRVDASTVESTLKKSGKVVARARTVVSADGKTVTITYVDAMGMATGTVLVYDKQ